MKLIPYSILFILSSSLFLSACGDKKQVTLKSVQPKRKAPLIKLTPKNTEYCPEVSALLRNTNMNWESKSGWKSHNPSFTQKVTAFEGAQWQGINNGKIICIYKGQENDFPITLQTNRLVARPPGNMWEISQSQSNNGSEIYNCFSNTPKNCPFPNVTYIWDENAAPQPSEDKPLPSPK